MKKNRSTLKDYFKKGAIPTEANFADLIDSMLTQDEDNISKLPNDPLKITATGVDEALLNFYHVENTVEKVVWQIKQKPDGKPGLNISDAAGSRLFIESGTGNIGVGTTSPAGYKLNVTGNALFTGNYLYVSSETAGRLRVGAAWNIPGLFSGDDGAKDLMLGVPANRKVYFGNGTGDAYIEGTTGNAYLKGNVGIGTTNTNKNMLRVEGGSISTTVNLHTQRGRVAFSNTSDDPNHTIYNNGNNIDTEGAWDGMKMNVLNGLEIRVGDANGKKPTAALRVDSTGNVGIGPNAPISRLTISEAIGTVGSANSGTLVLDHENSGGASSIVFRSKVNRGSDYAYIQYQDAATVGGTGEASVLSIGVQNDIDDHIALMPSLGNVGIGIMAPKAKLHVSGGQILLDGAQKIAFSDDDVSNNLKLQLWTGYGLGINGGTLFYAANGNHSWRDNGGVNERMLLTTGADGALTVRGTGVSSFVGNLGVGSTAPYNPQGWNKVLEVMGTSHARMNVRSSGGVITSVFSHDNWNGARGVIGTDSNHPLSFATAYTHRMTIDTNGDIWCTNRIGTGGWSPVPRTPGWGGGVHTWDIEAEGTVWSKGGYQSGNRDLAEEYQSDMDNIEPGDVVCLDVDKDRIVPSKQANDTMILGVISTAPGFLLNIPRETEGAHLFPVALCGRVPCKVTDENGPIKRGDLLTSSSTPGHAMKAMPIGVGDSSIFRPGTVIGKALGTLESGKGVIEVFVFSS